jgi:hypothetical protein
MPLTPDQQAEERRWVNQLDFEDLEEIMWEGVTEAFDGCPVEPDGRCPHGYRSPLLILGMM